MKYIYIIFTILIAVACKAQNPIINIEDWDGTNTPNAYYKDANNILSPYEGTWVYINSNTTFRIKLVKVTMSPFGNYYEDLLIGGYEYIVDGVTVYNTLPELLNITVQNQLRSIVGNNVIRNFQKPSCMDCVVNKMRPSLLIRDENLGGYITLFKTTIGGQPVLKIWIRIMEGRSYVPGEDDPYTGDAKFPIGEFTLIKEQ